MKHLLSTKKIHHIVRHFILSGILLFSIALQAQHNKTLIDSLEMRLNMTTLSNDEWIETCQNLVQAYLHVDREKALEYVRKGVHFAKKNKDYFNVASLYHDAGSVHYLLNQLDSSNYYFEQALVMIEEAVRKGGVDKDELDYVQMRIYVGLASMNYALGKYDLVLESFYRALAINERLNKPKDMAFLCSSIGNIYKVLQNFAQAEIYYIKSENIYRELGDSTGISMAYWGLCDVYRFKKDYSKALQYAEGSYRIASSIPHINPVYVQEALRRLTEVYSDMKDYDKAVEYGLKSIEYAKLTNRKDAISITLATLAKCYVEQKRYREAEEAAFQALAIDSTKASTNAGLYRIITVSNIWLKNHAKAVEYFNKAIEATNSYADQNFQKSLSEMEVKYETEKKEREIEQQRNIIARHKMQRWIFVGTIAVCAVFLFLLWYILRLRTRHNHLLAEQNVILSDINATKNKFFSIISHDLKNPVIAQRDALRTLNDCASTWTPEVLQEYYAKLLKSAEGQVELIYNLLNWAQFEMKRIPFNPAPFDLVFNLQNELSIVNEMAVSKGVTLKVDLPDSAVITADKAMICTVIRNLLTNAVKFTPENGTVTLTVEAKNISPHQPPPTRITIFDTGIGMSAEQLEELFRLNRKHSHVGTAGETGSGLGLIVCKEFIEKHNAKLNVESEVGKGSRFWFEV